MDEDAEGYLQPTSKPDSYLNMGHQSCQSTFPKASCSHKVHPANAHYNGVGYEQSPRGNENVFSTDQTSLPEHVPLISQVEYVETEPSSDNYSERYPKLVSNTAVHGGYGEELNHFYEGQPDNSFHVERYEGTFTDSLEGRLVNDGVELDMDMDMEMEQDAAGTLGVIFNQAISA